MILAAGRGERMRPLTDLTPKPLLTVAGKPLILWHIEKLAQSRFERIVINHAHLGEHIEEILGDGDAFGLEIVYSREAEALETAGGIATAMPLINQEIFPVINGDVFCGYDFSRFAGIMDAMKHNNMLAHLVLVDNPVHHPQGDFHLRHGMVDAEGRPRLTFSGIGVYRHDLFSATERWKKAPLAPLLKAAMAQGRVSGEHYAGRWVDVGTPDRLRELDQEMTNQSC
jgi:N-acetyl-alpha-D-muramate 1-phosphate uridylyltransferase